MNSNLKRLLTACVVVTSAIQVAAGSADKYDAQIEALLKKMTLLEKLGQLNFISNP